MHADIPIRSPHQPPADPHPGCHPRLVCHWRLVRQCRPAPLPEKKGNEANPKIPTGNPANAVRHQERTQNQPTSPPNEAKKAHHSPTPTALWDRCHTGGQGRPHPRWLHNERRKNRSLTVTALWDRCHAGGVDYCEWPQRMMVADCVIAGAVSETGQFVCPWIMRWVRRISATV